MNNHSPASFQVYSNKPVCLYFTCSSPSYLSNGFLYTCIFLRTDNSQMKCNNFVVLIALNTLISLFNWFFQMTTCVYAFTTECLYLTISNVLSPDRRYKCFARLLKGQALLPNLVFIFVNCFLNYAVFIFGRYCAMQCFYQYDRWLNWTGHSECQAGFRQCFLW